MKYQEKIEKQKEKNSFSGIKTINTVAGVDVSYYKKEKYEYGIACAVLWDLDKDKIENYYISRDRINFPYKAGFLGFRECKILSKVLLKLPKRPDLLMCDGHGKIHPRRFGEAVHLGLALNIPSMGIAKNPFIGYSEWKKLENNKGNKSPVWAKNPKEINQNSLNEILGYAICLSDDLKPVFISEGNKISIEDALKICLETTKKHRQPEPLFLADSISRKELDNY